MRTPRFPTWTRRAIAGVGAGAIVVAGCNEHFITGPRDSATLQLRNWSDTLVVGEQRASRVLVLDTDGHEIVGARVTWQTATPSVLGTRLYGGAAPSGATIDASASTDSLALTGAKPGTSDVLVALADTRFAPTQLARRATVVVAGVGVTSAHDTTITSLGDTVRVTGTAFMRSGSGLTASLTPLAGQGITWTRRGPGAITLVGTGDSVRAIASAPGVDTLITTHAFCLAHARCADTTVVHVAQTAQPLAMAATTFRAWSFGDSVSTQVIVQDARGNSIPGVQLTLVPLGASDSAIVGVNSAVGVPAMSRAAASTAPSAVANPAPTSTPSVARQAVSPMQPLRLVVGRRLTVLMARASVAAPPATPITAPPLVAQANGTARVAVQARLADGTLLGADTVSVIVRQVAKAVRVTPSYSDLTPGDSIPVHIDAHDARGHLIEDATFQPAMVGALYHDGRIIVPATAGTGTGVLQALVTGVASPANNPGAPITTPPPDTAHIAVRVPPAMSAGDTTSSDANTLGVTVRDRDGSPLRNAWVRFRIPAGSLQGPDSVQTDANGVVVLHWTLPTQPGSYTATAVLLGVPTPTDTAGLIVLRRTAVVTAGSSAALAMATQPPATSAMGVALSPAPVVQLADRYGNPVAQAGVVVTAAPAAGGNGFQWGGTLSATTGADGRAHFTAITGSGAPGSYALQFSATAGGTAIPAVVSSAVHFSIGAAQAGQSTVTISAPSVASGATARVVVTPRDAFGNVLGAGQSVTVTVPTSSPAGQATATASPVVDNGDGTYTATLTGVRAGTALTVGVTVGGAPLAGPTLVVTAGAPAALAIATQPPLASAMSVALTPAPVVQLVDHVGNAVPIANIAITVTPAAGGSGFLWGGTLSATTGANGQAQFAAITGNGTPGSYALQFSAIANGAALTPVVSSVVHFSVGAVHPGHSTVTVSAPTIVSGTTATVVVTPRDANNNVIGAGQTVLVTVPGSPATGQATATVSTVVDNNDGTYTATLTGVRAGTAFSIGATVGGVALTSPTLAVTAGPAATLAVTPAAVTLTAFGLGTPFTATAADAAGNPVATTGITWASGTTAVATIAATGTPTAASNGSTTITATLGGVSRTATLTVQQVAASLTKQAGDGQTATMSTSVANALVVRALDANSNPVVGATVQFAIASGAGTLASGATQAVSTVAGGTATAGTWVLGATTGANSVTATLAGVPALTFTATAGPALALSNTATERILRGTQQFGIAAGPSGPYTWSVGGVDGGNATYGTVSTSGFYTAPSSVPSPNVVQLCAREGPAATQRSCASVTVVAQPSPGADIVVMNDNVPLSDQTAGGGGLDGSHAPNEQFFHNLFGYTGTGPRASQTHVLVYQGHGAFNVSFNPTFDNTAVPGSGLDSLRTHLTQRGFTMDTTRSAVLSIPSNVKVLLLYMPTVTFTRTEVNAMKQFAAEGGRLVFIGNQTNFYGPVGVAVENNLMSQLGSALVNTSAQLLQGTGGGAYATTVGTHQLTAGVTGVWFAYCSYMTLGPNDFALMTDGAAGHVVMAVTKIDTTPIP